MPHFYEDDDYDDDYNNNYEDWVRKDPYLKLAGWENADIFASRMKLQIPFMSTESFCTFGAANTITFIYEEFQLHARKTIPESEIVKDNFIKFYDDYIQRNVQSFTKRLEDEVEKWKKKKEEIARQFKPMSKGEMKRTAELLAQYNREVEKINREYGVTEDNNDDDDDYLTVSDSD